MFAICSTITKLVLKLQSTEDTELNTKSIEIADDHEVTLQPTWYKLNISQTALEDNLDGIKQSRITELASETNGLIEESYPPHRQRTLTLLLVQGMATQPPLINRMNYIQSGLAWGIIAMQWYYQHETMIMSLSTKNSILNYTWDVSTLPPDPKVTIKAALAINN